MNCAFFACVQLGLIPVPVCPPSSHGFRAALYQMNHIAEDCGAAAVLTDRSYLWSIKLHNARTNLSTLWGKGGYTSRLKWIVTGDAEPTTGIGFPEAHSEVLFLQYTSGSTSEPKGVMVTHRNVISNCEGLFGHVPIGVSWLPQYHDMGLIGSYLFVALAGGTTYGISPIDFIQRPLVWLEAISRYRATVTAAPNFAYQYCLRPDKIEDDELDRLDLGSLRLVMNGAEPVRADVFRGFLRRFSARGLTEGSFCTAYGLAEYTLAVSNRGTRVASFDAKRLRADEVRVCESERAEGVDLVSCGAPVGSTEIRIVDVRDEARIAPEGRVGEVWVTGPSKCLGYWDRPDLTERVFEARLCGESGDERSWLRTGDLGFMRDGELFVCGRSKDLIIVRGLNYHPQDIEAIVEEDLLVRRGCVAAFAVEKGGGEALVVVAELRNAKRYPDVEMLNRSLSQRLGIVADTVVYIRARTIPKTSSGKIVRHRARAQWLESRLKVVAQVEAASYRRPPAAAPPADASRESLATMFRRYGLTGSQSLAVGEVGLDSLGVAEFALDLEKYLRARGATDLAAGIDVRWLQKIAVSELFELVRQLGASGPHAKVRLQRAMASLRREHQAIEHDMMMRDSRLPVGVPLPDRVEVSAGSRHNLGSSSDAGSTPGEGGILLTGGTGFFGPFLLRSLLEQCDDPIHVVVRAEDTAHGEERLREAMTSLGGPADPEFWETWRRRVIPVCGDLALPNLGLSPEDWASLAEGIHTVYHNGARVNYLLDYSAMRTANVLGTRDLVRFARSRRSKVVNYISTTFVFGWSSRDTLFESDDNQNLELLDFGYSQSKWVSEQIVLNAIREGLSARVFRPALIAPSVTGGGQHFDIAIRLLTFMLKHGISTTAQNQVSFSPADLVADNVVAISNLPDTVGETFHVTRDTHSTMLDITEVLGELTDTRFVNYDLADFVPHVIEHCRKDDLLFPLLNFLVRSVENITAMEFKRYDNRNYRLARARSPFGREDPPLEDVVSGIVRFLRRHGLVDGLDATRLLEKV